MRPPNPAHLLPNPHAITILSSINLLATALTLPYSPHNISFPLPSTNQNPTCVTNFDWIFPPFSATDCALAAHPILHLATTFSTHPFEFSALGQPARTSHPRFFLPARWASASCVITIAMLELYPPRALPGGGGSRVGVATDVGDWKGVWEAVRRVGKCVVSSEQCGWEAVGWEGGVGVFVWARESVMDEFTRHRVGEGRVMGVVGNRTVGGVQYPAKSHGQFRENT